MKKVNEESKFAAAFLTPMASLCLTIFRRSFRLSFLFCFRCLCWWRFLSLRALAFIISPKKRPFGKRKVFPIPRETISLAIYFLPSCFWRLFVFWTFTLSIRCPFAWWIISKICVILTGQGSIPWLIIFNHRGMKALLTKLPRNWTWTPSRESLSCAHAYDLNLETGMGNYFDGFSGFFRRNNDEDSSKRNPLKCFLEIGQNSWFQFMHLDFGGNNKWTDSSFVLIDGEFAPFQPKISFRSLPRINFGWLLNKNIPLDIGQRTTSTGILIFAADSQVELFYHSAKMSGLK